MKKPSTHPDPRPRSTALLHRVQREHRLRRAHIPVSALAAAADAPVRRHVSLTRFLHLSRRG